MSSPYLYSIKYDKEELDEYHRLFEEWNDIDYVLSFMIANKQLLDNTIWAKFSNPEEAAELDLKKFAHVGVCGATSTPSWLMEKIADMII